MGTVPQGDQTCNAKTDAQLTHCGTRGPTSGEQTVYSSCVAISHRPGEDSYLRNCRNLLIDAEKEGEPCVARILNYDEDRRAGYSDG